MKLVAQMIMGNEKDRYLKEVLEDLVSNKNIEKIIILDDASTDGSKELAESFGEKVKVHSTKKKESMFKKNESELRDMLWNITRSYKPEWVLSIDCDEMFDNSFKERLPELMENKCDWYQFHLCDMWDKDHYRVDGYWSPVILRLFRFKNEPFGRKGHIHCGCVPYYVTQSKTGECVSDVRCKHLGWSDDGEKKSKYDFYMNEAKVTGINYLHAKSIFNKDITLREFVETPELPTVKIFTLIRDREWCLPRFLKGIGLIDYPKEKLGLQIIINDSNDKSKEFLLNWKEKHAKEYKSIGIEEMNFGTPQAEHQWTLEKLKNMADMRNKGLEEIGEYDYLFSIDSDIKITKPGILKHLVNLDREVVSEVFWARWGRKESDWLPNVWIRGGYEVSTQFLAQMRYKGVYEVGGLGACTLISKGAIKKGINYTRIPSLPTNMEGEDRAFCVRCSEKGIVLWADTFYTPIHLEWHDEMLMDKLLSLKEKVLKGETIGLTTIMKNEEDFIYQMFQPIYKLFDKIVIVVDERSTDDTEKLCKKYGAEVIKHKWEGKDDSFAIARNKGVDALKTDWVMHLDPDEFVKLEEFANLLIAMGDKNTDAFIFSCANYHMSKQVTLTETMRMFRNKPRLRYTGSCHETLEDSIRANKYNVKASPMFLHHKGFLRGNEYVQGKLNRYIKLNEKDMKERPNDARPYFNLALHFLNDSKGEDEMWLKGMTYLKQAIKLSPTFFQPHRELGIEYMRVGMKLLKKAVTIAPKGHPSIRYFGEILKFLDDRIQDRIVVGESDEQKENADVASRRN